ncbi:MAG: hypothetical protein AAFN50_12145 [Pseudomonadota bacterium]
MRTTIATDWDDPADEPAVSKVLRRILLEANPTYRKNMHLVDAWYIEFTEDGLPYREIGVDANGSPVLAGPSSEDYGFWLDTNMTQSDFEGVEVNQDEFEALWSKAEVVS